MCKTCSQPATKDVLECIWCEGCQHRGCTKISADVCNALSSVIDNIVFFCSPCLQILPVALKYYDTQSYVDPNFTRIESSLLEIQSLKQKYMTLLTNLRPTLMTTTNCLAHLKTNWMLKKRQLIPCQPMQIPQQQIQLLHLPTIQLAPLLSA